MKVEVIPHNKVLPSHRELVQDKEGNIGLITKVSSSGLATVVILKSTRKGEEGQLKEQFTSDLTKFEGKLILSN